MVTVLIVPLRNIGPKISYAKMAAMLRILPLLLLISAPLFSQQQSSLGEQLNREAGIEMSFREPRPPVSRMTFSAVGTGELNGRKLIRYSITVSGLAQRGPFILMTWDIGTNAPLISIKQLTVDEKGTLRCGNHKNDCPGEAPGSEVVIGVSGMIGQPRRFILTGDDKKPIAMGETVPFPALDTDGQCSIEAVLLAPNAAATLIVGRGFVQGEPIKFTSSSSYGEALESDKTADQAGNVTTLVLPFVKGHDEGKTSVTFNGSKCRPSTAFNWGSYHEEQMQSMANQ